VSSEIDPANQEAEQALMARLGITRVQTDAFWCGPYRYTNLKDAIAEGKRNELANSP
jgi:hypothetical protein